jgi:hypothetical protein
MWRALRLSSVQVTNSSLPDLVSNAPRVAPMNISPLEVVMGPPTFGRLVLAMPLRFEFIYNT